MSGYCFALVLSVLSSVIPIGNAQKQVVTTPGSEKEKFIVGSVFLIFNDASSSGSICKTLPFKSGQVIGFAELQKAERDLAKTDLFIVDAKSGIGPTVTDVAPRPVSTLEINPITGIPYPKPKYSTRNIIVRVRERDALKLFPKGQQFDFGEVACGPTRPRCSFPIVNNTGKPVTIVTKVRGCGSIVYESTLTKKSLQPNEKGELRIVLDSYRAWSRRWGFVYVDVESDGWQKQYIFTVGIISKCDPNLPDNSTEYISVGSKR